MANPNTQQQDVLTDIESHTPESLHPILEAAFKYRKQLVIAVSIILGVTAIYAGISAYNAKAKSSAQAELGAILVETPAAEKATKLEALLAEVPGSVKPAVILAIAENSMTNGDYAKAVTYWDMLISDTSGETQLAIKLGKSKSLLFDGKAKEAMEELKPLAADAPEAFIVPVNRQLALAAETAGDTATALEAYKKLAEKNVKDKPFVDYKISQLEAK